ncbi:unnamed protein product [Candidula unifasciata]|uniref:Coiled-coil protein 142 C-terminal domain-containing protein n=1 Tax=Candidula unifasciata TaxID=100452 RepID=A0A8S3YW18_9EUPU|nr:unnamed protein product [Candidula unifasciata]
MSQLKFKGRGALLKARQPPIHMLGKHTPVDEDEPPDVPVQAFGFDTDSDNSSSFVTTFDAADAEDASKYLRKAFNILQPGYHACKRMPEMDGGYFSHCPRGVPLGQQYSNLRILMEERAQLELLKDCLLRVKFTQIFVEELEGLVHMECRTAHTLRHGGCAEPAVTKVYCLNALCEDLRLHVAHWNSIKQRLNTNHWLQQKLGHLCLQLQHIMQVLTSSILKAVHNLDQLIHIGFEVFAHCNMDTVTPEMMWNITRGLEDFNIIVNGLKLNYQVNKSQMYGMDYLLAVSDNHSCLANLPIQKPLRIIPFTKVLSILASERSKYAAKLTHKFFTSNEDFLHMVNTGNLPAFDWGDYLPHQNQPHSMMVQSDTSDYHTLTASSASLTAAYVHVGSIRAPDMSGLASPLIQFSQKEQEFAESFLLIVCNSTSLLRKHDPQKPHRVHHGSKQVDSKSTMSPVVGRPPRVQFQGDTPVMSRTDSQRKTVSWVDNADNSIRTAVVAHYMDSLWTQFGRNLDLYLDEPAWIGRNCLLHSEMGSLLLFNDAVIAVLRNMIDHVCCKNIFPVASVQPLLGVMFRLHALSAYGAWDALLSAYLASETTDKCQPCLLNSESYSTCTGRILRNMYSPLMSMLQEINRCFPQNLDDTAQRPSVDLGVCVGVTLRVLMTCRLALSWCTMKIQHLLSSWSVHQYLFLTHSDLKLLVDCTKSMSSLLQSLNFSEEHFVIKVADSLCVCQIALLQEQIGQVNAQMQSLSGSTMKSFIEKYSEHALNFFQESLLPARAWKKKLLPEESAEPSSYTVNAVESLLVPIVQGISKLSTATQIGVISLVTMSFCNTWLGIILKEKIRFSLWGAVQLGIDFEYVRTQIGQMVANEEVRQSVTDLPIFQQMRGIVFLLKRQPSQKQSSSRLMDNIMCDSASAVPSPDVPSADARTITPVSTGSTTLGNGMHKSNTGAQLSQEEEDINTVPNVQEWLALRTIGGSKPWKFPACFARSSSDD